MAAAGNISNDILKNIFLIKRVGKLFKIWKILFDRKKGAYYLGSYLQYITNVNHIMY